MPIALPQGNLRRLCPPGSVKPVIRTAVGRGPQRRQIVRSYCAPTEEGPSWYLALHMTNTSTYANPTMTYTLATSITVYPNQCVWNSPPPPPSLVS